MKQLKNKIKGVNRGIFYTHMISDKQKTQCHFESDSIGQSGRSMVEMLGVLAIIGVLGVAGIAGYTSALNKHKANKILNDTSLRAVVASTQIQRGVGNPTLSEFTNNDLGCGSFDTTVYTKGNLASMPKEQFGIKVSGVSKEICQEILNTIGDKTVMRRISDASALTTPLTTCNDTNSFFIIYNNDLSAKPVASEFTYDNCPENFYKCSTTTSCVVSENDCPSICGLNEELSSGCVCPEHRNRTDNKCGDCVNEEIYTSWTQPVLSSNGTMGGSDAFATTASTELDGTRKAWRAFDGVNNDPATNCWHSRSEMGKWLSWYTKNPIKISSITIHNRGDGGAVGCLAVSDFQLQYSDDNSNWVTIVSGINPSNSFYASYNQVVNASSAHSYWRLNILSSWMPDGKKAQDSLVAIGELKINADELKITKYNLNEETLMCE